MKQLDMLSAPSARQWSRIGLARRSGVAAALFSLRSRHSVGIGELLDLELLVDWCRQTGMSMIQLLPMHDVGFDFRPYDAQSAMALEPMYLSLHQLTDVPVALFQNEIQALRQRFSGASGKVDYGIKQAKLDLLWKMFQDIPAGQNPVFEVYRREQSGWLVDYARYKVIKESQDGRSWEQWPAAIRLRQSQALLQLDTEQDRRIRFHMWMQWQLFEQLTRLRRYARSQEVLLMGDLPFLVARDSADVWSQPQYFDLDGSAGAPPDLFFARGQRWGMPPYRWDRMAADGYGYLVRRLRYAENFYDLFRIDHFVGIFRLWTIPNSQPVEDAGLHGTFVPPDERAWESHGRPIVSVMLEHTAMLPCAEDLGTVPACSYKLLEEMALPGMDVQRWTRDWGASYDFKSPSEYRQNSVAVISTHDTATLRGWWETEAGTVSEELFRRIFRDRGLPFDALCDRLFDRAASPRGRLRWRPQVADVQALTAILGRAAQDIPEIVDFYRGSFDEKRRFWEFLGLGGPCSERASISLVRAILERINQTTSIFSVQLLQDWLALDERMAGGPSAWRINVPGEIDGNWSVVLPFSLEEMLTLGINREIRQINQEAERI